MISKKRLSLAERIRRIFVREPLPVMHPTLLTERKPANATAVQDETMAFKAGAAIAFVTPIGAYAGNANENDMRQKAQQQFLAMEHSQNMTIN